MGQPTDERVEVMSYGRTSGGNPHLEVAWPPALVIGGQPMCGLGVTVPATITAIGCHLPNASPWAGTLNSVNQFGNTYYNYTSKQLQVTPSTTGLAVHADNAAAVGAGMTVGQHYQTATGQLMIVY